MNDVCDVPESGGGATYVRRFRIVLVAALVGVLLLSAAGCRSASATTDRSPASVIKLAGSGCCVTSLQILVEDYPGNDEVQFDFVPAVACADGVESVRTGRIDIAAVENPLEADDQNLGLRYIPLSRDHLAVAVNPSAHVSQLSLEELRDIYTGQYESWAQLGGADLPIIVLDSVEHEPAKQVLRRIALGEEAVTPRAVTMFYEEDIATAVQKTSGSIGCLSAGYARAIDLQADIVRVGGTGTADDFLESDYSATRIVGIVYSAGARDEVRDFVEWASGAQAADVLENEGFEAANSASDQ